MNSVSPLDQLRDIHTPADIGWWPLSLTWWVIIILVTVLVALVSVMILKYWRKNTWRRLAISEFRTLKRAQPNLSNANFASQLAILLKRCIASADRSNQGVFSASENELIDMINNTPCKKNLPETLVNIVCREAYKPNCPAIEDKELSNVEQWIKGLTNA